MMDDAYVTKLENGAYRVAATRVSLDSKKLDGKCIHEGWVSSWKGLKHDG